MNTDRSSDGPYTDGGGRGAHVIGPGLEDKQQRTFIDVDLASLLNLAHAEGRKAAEKYTEKMLVFAKDEVRKCHEEIRRLEEKYARNVYKMP